MSSATIAPFGSQSQNVSASADATTEDAQPSQSAKESGDEASQRQKDGGGGGGGVEGGGESGSCIAPHQTKNRCSCGNFFMSDSSYCRKCGKPRPTLSPPRINTSSQGDNPIQKDLVHTTTPLSGASTPLPVIKLDVNNGSLSSNEDGAESGREPPQRVSCVLRFQNLLFFLL